MRPNKSFGFAMASILFLVSGATGLGYEIIWFKQLSHVWGNSAMAMGMVVASFLCGLGIGAYWIGRFADRVKRPLLWYAACEAGIGLFALAIPWLLDLLPAFTALFYEQLHGYPVLYAAVQFLATLLAIGPAAVLMGGTLPLFVREFTGHDAARDRVTGWFYGINTAGAAMGCYAVGFHLLPAIGLHWTNLLFAATNGVIALLAAGLSFGTRDAATESPTNAKKASKKPQLDEDLAASFPRLLYVAAGLTGCASLVLQMVWARKLSLMLGSSTYAFSATLLVFLIGIGLGSLMYHLWIKGAAGGAEKMLVIVLILVVSATAGKLLIPQLTLLVGLLGPLRSDLLGNAAVCIFASAVLQLLPTLMMGVLFPLFVQLTCSSGEHIGAAVGTVYMCNTIGSIAGALLTTSWLIPAFGSDQTFAIALSLYICILPLLYMRRSARAFGGLVATCVVCAGAVMLSSKQADPRVTDYGMYMYGYQPLSILQKEESDRSVLYFEEGRVCNVMVTRDQANQRSLRVHGKVDASSEGDMDMQSGLAFFPRILHPHAEDVLVIGFGSGVTSGCSLLFPDTNVTCCEIEPAVLGASRFFHDVNHAPEDSPHFHVIVDDGRFHLQATKQQYDLILSEPSNPWIAGVSNLFTKQFYQAAKARLKPGGILVQWAQTYSLTASEYAMIVRTVREEFPHNAVIRISSADTLILASMEPFDLSQENLAAAQELVDNNPDIKADLEEYLTSSDVKSLLLNHLLLDEQGMQRLEESQGTSREITDQNMILEFLAPLRLYEPELDAKEHPDEAILAAVDPQWIGDLFGEMNCGAEQLEAIRSAVRILELNGRADQTETLIDLGLSVDADDPFFVGRRLLTARMNDLETARSEYRHIAEISPAEATRTGVALWRAGRSTEAVLLFTELVKLHPNSATSWTNLASNYRTLGLHEQAQAALDRAMEIDPVELFATQLQDTIDSTHRPTRDGPKTTPAPVRSDSSTRPDSP